MFAFLWGWTKIATIMIREYLLSVTSGNGNTDSRGICIPKRIGIPKYLFVSIVGIFVGQVAGQRINYFYLSNVTYKDTIV